MLEEIGKRVRLKVASLLYSLGFAFNVVKECLFYFKKNKVGFKVLTMQILFTGYEALKINTVMALAIGAAINVIGNSLMAQFGQSQLMYTILIMVITRELGPLLTAFIITARSGTAIATQLGTMVVDHEIEAYVSVGLNPISYLIAPRVLGVVISTMVLSAYFNMFGLMGSYFISQFFAPIPISEYFHGLLTTIKITDLVSGLTKAFVFGLIISIVSSYQGISVNKANTEVPVAGIKAVGQSFMLIIVADVIITLVQYAG